MSHPGIPPTITALPEAPTRRESPEEFSEKAATFVAALEPFRGEMSDAVGWTNNAVTFVNERANSAQLNAESAQEDAQTASAAAQSAAESASSATLAPGTSATSASTATPGVGVKSITLDQTGKTFLVGQFVTVADAVSPGEKFFNGAITSFDSGTGEMEIDSRAFAGSTSGSSWVVTGSAPAFGQRFTSPTQSFVALGTVSGTVNLDLRVALNFSCTLSGNTTFTVTLPDDYNASTDAISFAVSLTMGSSAYTIGYPAGTKYHEGANPVTAPNTTDILVYTKRGGGDIVVRRAARDVK